MAISAFIATSTIEIATVAPLLRNDSPGARVDAFEYSATLCALRVQIYKDLTPTPVRSTYFVIPAKAGIQKLGHLDSGSPRCIVRNDGCW